MAKVEDQFERYTRLRRSVSSAEFMDILLDTYEKSLNTPTGYDMIDGFTTDEQVHTPVKKRKQTKVLPKEQPNG